jgi:hypothetical protein
MAGFPEAESGRIILKYYLHEKNFPAEPFVAIVLACYGSKKGIPLSLSRR